MGHSPGVGSSGTTSGSTDMGDGTTGVSDSVDGDVIVGAPDDSTGPAATPIRQRNPPDPTPMERDAHVCGGHVDFMPWCIDCCRGRT